MTPPSSGAGTGQPDEPRDSAAADRATAIISDWAAGQYAIVRASFDATMTETLPADKLAAAWDQVIGTAGTLRRMGDPSLRPQGGFTVVDIPLKFDAGELKGRVTFNADDQVSGLFILDADVP